MIKFKNVHKHFKDLHVINGVNLEVKQGEVVVVCGPSGSGKSTLIRTVNQLERIESGEIWVDGINVADPKTDLNKVREEVGFVFQGFNLYPHLTVLENIILSPMKVKNQSREEAEKKAMELLERVGLAHKKDALPGQLLGPAVGGGVELLAGETVLPRNVRDVGMVPGAGRGDDHACEPGALPLPRAGLDRQKSVTAHGIMPAAHASTAAAGRGPHGRVNAPGGQRRRGKLRGSHRGDMHRTPDGQPARPLPAGDQAVQGQGGEETDEHVQQPDAGLGQGHAVDRQEQPGQARHQR